MVPDDRDRPVEVLIADNDARIEPAAWPLHDGQHFGVSARA